MNLDDDTPALTDDAALAEPALDSAPAGDDAQADPAHGGEDDAVAFTFEGEEGAGEDRPDDSPPLREVRNRLRQEQREKAELRRELEALKAPKEAGPGPKPTLESCGYDEEEFEKQVLAWGAKKSEADREAEAAQAKQREQQEAWANRVITFEKKATELVPNFRETAQSVADHFGNDDAGNVAKAILIYADDPRLIAALNSSPAKLAELVALKNDPTALAIAVGELKGKIRTMPRRSAPAPEAITKGGAPTAASTDKELERLVKEADRTGDRSAVIAYRRNQRAQA